jgi:hypothetical protein
MNGAGAGPKLDQLRNTARGGFFYAQLVKCLCPASGAGYFPVCKKGSLLKIRSTFVLT